MDALERGINAAAAGDLLAAIQAYSDAIEAKVRLPLAYRHRGHAYLTNGEWEKAIADLTNAIQLDTNAVNLYVNRGYALSQIGDYDSALSDLIEALRIDPDLASTHRYRGYVYLEMGKFAEAIADFTRSVALGLANAHLVSHCISSRGYAYWQMEQFDHAMADFTEAIRQDPNNAFAFYCRGVSYERAGDRTKAIMDFAQARKLGYRRSKEDITATQPGKHHR